jgi:hypothetical protein
LKIHSGAFRSDFNARETKAAVLRCFVEMKKRGATQIGRFRTHLRRKTKRTAYLEAVHLLIELYL